MKSLTKFTNSLKPGRTRLPPGITGHRAGHAGTGPSFNPWAKSSGQQRRSAFRRRNMFQRTLTLSHHLSPQTPRLRAAVSKTHPKRPLRPGWARSPTRKGKGKHVPPKDCRGGRWTSLGQAGQGQGIGGITDKLGAFLDPRVMGGCSRESVGEKRTSRISPPASAPQVGPQVFHFPPSPLSCRCSESWAFLQAGC